MLAGIRVIELASIGPGPHAGMLLADLGAEVTRVDRPARAGAFDQSDRRDPTLRGRRYVELDLKTAAGRDQALALVADADVVVEGNRPGVAERLGVGPADCHAVNPRLVYGRVTGWGQTGPRAERAGHDINYVSLTGVLHAIGRPGHRPPPPLNLIGDYGGGSMFLVVGILAALWDRERTGVGRVVDAAMVDGVSVLAQAMRDLLARGEWADVPGANLLDGAAPFYDTYRCSDGRYVAVGALEPKFYAQLLAGLGLDAEALPEQYDRVGWPLLRERFTVAFASHTRDEWAEHFYDTDACVTPVLSFGEAALDPHLRARGTLIESGGVIQAAPAPRFDP
jgi:alpha-methylacyl-CoA racemase